MTNPGARKIADRIQEIVAEMLERRVKDPRLGFVTVTDVRVTGDTQHATVFYTVLADGDDESALAATGAALESAKGMIRSEVGKQLGMRHVPTLEFVADALPETARHLDEVLAKARAQDEAVAAARGATYAGDEDPYKKPRATEDEALPDAGEDGGARAGRRRQARRDHLPRRGLADPAAGRHPQGRSRRHA